MRPPVWACYNGVVPQLILDRVEAVPCPCGATPKPGEKYCGDDCTPAPGAGLSVGAAKRTQPDSDPWADVMPAPCACCGEGWWTTRPDTRCLNTAT